MARTTTKRNM